VAHRHLQHLILAAAAVAAVAACGGQGGVGRVVGGPLGGAGGGTPTSTSAPGPSGTTGATVTPAPSTTVVGPTTAAPGTTAPGATAPAGRLRLGGDDLGATRVGAPFRDAVAAVTAELGSPSGDPPGDTACIGAEDEAAWGPFRLASSGGRVSGWRSTSKTLATPAGVTAGTTLSALRQAYGDLVEVRPPPEPDGLPVFVVGGARIGGTLTGQAPTDTVTTLFNGTCEAA
jgi:hypothetical protein